ncbi:hypothetical protein [Aeromonas sp. sif2416]|uniref:hypothetical protein n=1 Tax=Aeromonas sp. sif2416 TaxID=2854793 RepID=UPI001C445AFA|nr:hypothetical protein [Aeromonas sp. sif2416]MBV7439692.1 hypothetical protein [Aeromonas sp. sif2416]
MKTDRKLRDELDEDENYNRVRNKLMIISCVFLTINVAGIKIEEINTFIFKLSISNISSFSMLMALAVIFLCARYYAYSEVYRKKISEIWINRLLSDRRVFKYYPADSQSEEYNSGLLSYAISDWPGDEPGAASPRYKIGWGYKRYITYDLNQIDEHDNSAEIPLYKFTTTWTCKNLLMLLKYEAKYQVECIIGTREFLDIYSPYLVASSAIISYVYTYAH